MLKGTEANIINLIQDALKPSKEHITINSAMEEVGEWDSLGHLGVLAALDKFFDGKVGEIKEIGSASSVQEILQILKNNSLI